MSVKKTIISSLLVAGLSMPLFAQAADLVITNNTKRDSTIIANNGACSTILGDVGVTKAGAINTVPEAKIAQACTLSILKKKDCKADVYMNSGCSGPVVATVYFDIQKDGSGKIIGSGLRPVKPDDIIDKSYSVSGGGFNVTIKGGPAALAKK